MHFAIPSVRPLYRSNWNLLPNELGRRGQGQRCLAANCKRAAILTKPSLLVYHTQVICRQATFTTPNVLLGVRDYKQKSALLL